jgi:TolB-like protein/class 3 adenylate cyclase/Tfp pilus assembly protein PilF
MPPNPVERKLAAILSADVVGYSRLMSRDEVATVRTLTAYRDQMEVLIRQYRGRIVDSPGDNVLAEFPSATDALECAGEIQRVLQARNAPLPPERRMEFRLGVHLGEVMVEGERIYGDGVNVAARLEGLAEAGGICISQTVRDQVESKVRLRYEDLGEQEMKNITRPVHAYRARWETLETPSGAASPSAARRSRPPMLAAVLALLIVGGAIWLLYPGGPVPEAGTIRSIAVLPLENLSGDPEQEYFVDGMTEVLITDLARVRGLRVISRTSSMAYRNSGKTLPQIARELRVDAVVEGSVLRVGDRVRITAQLIQASSDEHLWSDSYERGLQDVLALQGEVARAIAGEIELQLSGPEDRGEAARRVDPGAFEAYLKGRHHWNRRTGADIQKSIEYFETAIALDPDWALAHSGLAQAYVILANFDPLVEPRDSMPRARAAAERALDLDDELAPAHTALAAVRGWYDWDWEGAEAEFQRALELDPSYATAHFWYGFPPITNKSDAIEHLQRARELDPLSMIIGTGMGIVLLLTDEYDRSIETLRETLELDPSFALAQVFLARAYAVKGMHEEAVEVAERFARTDPESPRSRVTLAETYALRRARGGGRGLRVDGEGVRASSTDALVDPGRPAPRPPPLRPPLRRPAAADEPGRVARLRPDAGTELLQVPRHALDVAGRVQRGPRAPRALQRIDAQGLRA